jgi:hypothetical protein
LLGTKLRALYQRSKGRDLFDLIYARQNLELDYEKIILCFKEYTTFATGNRPPSKKEFLLNIEEKEKNPEFTGDLEALLRPEIYYKQSDALEWLKREIVNRIVSPLLTPSFIKPKRWPTLPKINWLCSTYHQAINTTCTQAQRICAKVSMGFRAWSTLMLTVYRDMAKCLHLSTRGATS